MTRVAALTLFAAFALAPALVRAQVAAPPIAEERFQGNLAPSLAGAGARWSVAQLRLRIVDGARLNPDTIMPPYYRTAGLQRVAKPFEGKTILTAEQVEDVVAYLATLKE